MIFFCNNKCCKISVEPYIQKDTFLDNKINKQKAGIFIFDKKHNKILLVQSRGNLWGIPKGSFEDGETKEECAIREVFEETGIKIDKELLDNRRYLTIADNCFYYYFEMEEIPVEIQKNINNEANDANGIGWINLTCLQELIKQGLINLNNHCIKILNFFIG